MLVDNCLQLRYCDLMFERIKSIFTRKLSNINSVEALRNDAYMEIPWGEEMYEVKRLTLQQTLDILQLIGLELNLLRAYMKEGASDMELIGVFLKVIRPEKVEKLVQLLIPVPNDKVQEGFSNVNLITLLNAILAQENAKELFLGLSHLRNHLTFLDRVPVDPAIQKVMKGELTPSSQELKRSRQNTDIKMSTSSAKRGSGSSQE